jgi:DNA-binding transcriptional regulator YiaG
MLELYDTFNDLQKILNNSNIKIVKCDLFPGYYFTDNGKIFKENYKGTKGKIKEIKQTITNKGYLRVKIIVNKKHKHICVHRLILIAFEGLSKNKKDECRHLDGDKKNNKINNLKWGSRKENENDKIRHGTHNMGTNNPRSVLTESQVKEIRTSTLKHDVLAELYGVSKSVISTVQTYKNYRNVMDDDSSLLLERIKGRRIGENHKRSKLSEADILEIRESSLTNRQLADKFKVTWENIKRIKARITWRHI